MLSDLNDNFFPFFLFNSLVFIVIKSSVEDKFGIFFKFLLLSLVVLLLL